MMRINIDEFVEIIEHKNKTGSQFNGSEYAGMMFVNHLQLEELLLYLSEIGYDIQEHGNYIENIAVDRIVVCDDIIENINKYVVCVNVIRRSAWVEKKGGPFGFICICEENCYTTDNSDVDIANLLT